MEQMLLTGQGYAVGIVVHSITIGGISEGVTMSSAIEIRPYSAEDLPRVQTLETQVTPYRPEDHTEVQAMFARAQQAEQMHDERWVSEHDAGLDDTPDTYPAFWVAEQVEAGTPPALVGTVGVRPFCAGLEMPRTLHLAQEWQDRGDIVELRRLRVAPEVRRQGLGVRLCQTVIDWARQKGYRTLVVNTTSSQVPALQLYKRVGFREVGLSFIGAYELVWLELSL
jgi:GNAT superfamily N-acetyltransferase